MPPLKFTEVLSFSSEDPNHPAENLLRPDTFRKWKCSAGSSEKQASVTLKLERLSAIHSIDIGNEGAAFVEVLVAREGGDFQVLLVASSFMTPGDSRNSTNLSRVRMFSSDKLNKNVAEQKWDRLKVICTQPFNKNMQYGLSFITVNSPSEGSSASTPKGIRLGSFTLKDEEESDSISVGSVFARRKEADSSSPVTGAAAIRAASVSAAAASNSSPSSEPKKAKPNNNNAPDVGFYQLKKKASSVVEQASTPVAVKRSSSDGSKEKDKASEKKRNFSWESEKSKERDKDKKRKDDEPKDQKEKDKQRKNNDPEKRKPELDKKKASAEGLKRKQSNSSNQTPSGSSGTPVRRKSAPFALLLKDVTFALSGYQNPQRSQIRDSLIEMGARYKPDWDPSCTHLICAFANTPKYNQVKGKGRIVTAKWVSDCHKNKIRYPCKRYALDKQQNGEDSEEEVWAEELLPKEEKPKTSLATATSDNDEFQDDKNNYDSYTDSENTDDEIERVLARQRMKAKTDDNTKASNSSEIKSEEPQHKKTKDKDKSKPKPSDTSDGSSEEPPPKRIKNEASEKQRAVVTPSRKTNEADVKHKLNGTEDSIYDDDTDIDEDNKEHVTRPDTSSISLPTLGNYLKGKCFFIYGNMSTDMRQLLSRYIIAFDGTLEDYMSEKVNFVLTEDEWDDNFDDALSENSSLQFVKPSWIWRCCDKKKLVPFQPFMVVPKD